VISRKGPETRGCGRRGPLGILPMPFPPRTSLVWPRESIGLPIEFGLFASTLQWKQGFDLSCATALGNEIDTPSGKVASSRAGEGGLQTLTNHLSTLCALTGRFPPTSPRGRGFFTITPSFATWVWLYLLASGLMRWQHFGGDDEDRFRLDWRTSGLLEVQTDWQPSTQDNHSACLATPQVQR
jgi:hypothetical protein